MYPRGLANRLALRASPGETPDCLRSCRLPAGRKWLRPQVVAANGLRDFTAGRRIADTPRRCHQKLRGTPDRPQRPPPAAIAHGGEPTDLRAPEVCSSSSRRPRLTDTQSDAEWQPAQSGLITGGGADLRCDGRRAGPAILMRLALTSRRVPQLRPSRETHAEEAHSERSAA